MASSAELTLNLGLRYEVQTNIRDWRDWAPRASAWAPGGEGKEAGRRPYFAPDSGSSTTVSFSNTLTAERYDGIIQQQYVVPP